MSRSPHHCSKRVENSLWRYTGEAHAARVHHRPEAYPSAAATSTAPTRMDFSVGTGRILVCDRDPKWSRAVEQWLSTAGVRVLRTPPGAPNCNAHAERFVRSVKEECLRRVVPLGEWHLRRTLREFITHYQRERNHQGLSNELIDGPAAERWSGAVHRRQRVGGILSYYYRSAA